MAADLASRIGAVTSEIGACLARVDAREATRAIEMLDAAECIFLAGAGRSGLAVRAFAMRLMHLGKRAHVVGEVTAPAIARGDLLVAGSGSGATPSLEAVARKASEVGASVLLVTLALESPIGRLADHTVRIPAPSPKAPEAAATMPSCQPMGSLFEQCLWLLGDIAILELMERSGTTAEAMFTRHANLE